MYIYKIYIYIICTHARVFILCLHTWRQDEIGSDCSAANHILFAWVIVLHTCLLDISPRGIYCNLQSEKSRLSCSVPQQRDNLNLKWLAMTGHHLLWFAVSLQLIAVRQLNLSWRKHSNLLLAASWSSRGEEIPWQEHWLGKRSIQGTANKCAKDHKVSFQTRVQNSLNSPSPLCSSQQAGQILALQWITSVRLISHWFHLRPGALAANLYFGQEWKVREGASHNAVPRETFTWKLGIGVVVACAVSSRVSQVSRSRSLCFSYFGWALESCNARWFTLLYISLTTPQNPQMKR